MSKYHVGQVLWFAQYTKTVQVTKTCPICYGNKKVHLTLGNGDVLEVPCEHCRYNGLGEPQGTVKVWEHGTAPRQVTITKVIEETQVSGTKTEYRQNCDCLAEDLLFVAEEAAMVKCQELFREAEETETCKLKTMESYVKNAGYHLEAAARARREVASHEAMAARCTEKAR